MPLRVLGCCFNIGILLIQFPCYFLVFQKHFPLKVTVQETGVLCHFGHHVFRHLWCKVCLKILRTQTGADECWKAGLSSDSGFILYLDPSE